MSHVIEGDLADERWLITGANGFLGANAGLILSDRVSTIGVTRESRSSTSQTTVNADLLDSAALRDLVRSIKPSVILHTAAMASHESCEASPEMAMRVNSGVPGVLAQAAGEIGATMIQISTDAVFDGGRGDYSELDEVNPFSVYGITKLEGEHAVIEVGGRSIVARTNFFGWSPTGTRSILEFFVEGLRSGRTMPGYTDFRVTSLYVRELVESLWSLTRLNAAGTFHVASHDSLTKFEFGQVVARELGLSEAAVTATACFETSDSLRSGRDISLDVDKLEKFLARPMQTQQAGIAAALAEETVMRRGL